MSPAQKLRVLDPVLRKGLDPSAPQRRSLSVGYMYRRLQFRLNVTRIRGFSPETVYLERAYANVLLCFRISA